MAQDSEQPQMPSMPPIRPESNGYYEHNTQHAPEPYASDISAHEAEGQPASGETDQPPDPQYPYGAYHEVPQAGSSGEADIASNAPTFDDRSGTNKSEVEIPVHTTQSEPSGSSLEQPSYDSPEFYAQPRQSVQEQRPSLPQQPVYGEVPLYPAPAPQGVGTPSTIPYGAATGYGHGGTPQYPYRANAPYGYNGYRRFDFDAEPHSSPLAFAPAVRGLLTQYWNVVIHPSTKTFAREMGKAEWNIVWFQIVFYAIVTALFSLISTIGFDLNTEVNTVMTGMDTSGFTQATIDTLRNVLTASFYASLYGQILITPLVLFISTGIIYLLAKAFGGTGTFLTQLYTTLLFVVPLGIAGNFVILLFSYLPFAGGTFTFLLGLARLVYEGILLGFLLIPVHRISGGRATGVVLLLVGVVFLLACVMGFVFAAILAATLSPS